MKLILAAVIFLMPIYTLSALFPAVATADDTYTFVVKKQEEKKKTGWSLSEWLETRDRMRLQDLWLALHTSSPFEFHLGGTYQFSESPTLGNYTGWDFHAAAFVSIFGLGFERETLSDSLGSVRMHGKFFFRFFGRHDQSTNMTLQAGVKTEDRASGASYRNAFWGISATLYLMKYFGGEGLWRYYYDSPVNNTGSIFNGSRYEGGAFLDFSFFRVFGKYYNETQTAIGGIALNRSGWIVGGRLYF